MRRIFLVTLVLAACTASAVGAPSNAQLAGQRVGWPVDGTRISAGMRAAIARGEVGAVLLFGRNASSAAAVSRLTREIQSVARPAGLDQPILVMTDQEGGLVTRVRSVGPSASAARMGATMTTAQIRAQGVLTGRGLAALGITANLAPVCDIAAKRANIGRDQRAFGSTAATVASRCTAFAHGLAVGGVAAAIKHFPGFGRARVNTDDAPVRITASRAALAVDLVPFATAIRSGAPMVLVSSAVYPALAPHPAMLSRTVSVDLLRRDMGFRGVTVSDAIDTPALRSWGGTRRAAGRAAAAGMDLVLVSGTEAAARHAQAGIAAALASGAISSSDAQASLSRLLALRRQPATG